MGSLFKPSTTIVQAPQQSTTSYDIPSYFKEIQERTLRRAEEVGSRPYQAYTGQRIAQLTPEEIMAGNVVSQQILPTAQGLGAIGAKTFDTATMQQYMNPYTNAVIQSTLSDLGETYGQQQRAMATQAIGAGAFGGSREGVERALGRERYLDQVADVSGRLRQAGFESGAQRFAQDRATQLQAAQSQLSGLAGAAAGLGQYGATARGIEQAGLAEAYRDFIEEREYPAGQIRQMIGALAGAPIRTYGEERSGFVGTPVGAPSTFAQIAGMGQALSGFK